MKFKLMKKDSVFINIGRGQTVVEKDLVIALKKGIIAGAALDVFKEEPLSPTSELYDMKNALITFHCAYNTPNYFENCIRDFKHNLQKYQRETK